MGGAELPEWADLLKTLPQVGVTGVVIFFWWQAKQERDKAVEELKRSNELRVSEAMEMTKVITANTEASNARDRSQEQLSAALNAQSTAVMQAVLAGARR